MKNIRPYNERFKRLRQLVATTVAATVLILLPFVFRDYITSESVELVKVLLWPFVLLAALALYEHEVIAVLESLTDRIKRGASVKIASIEIGAMESRIAVPASGDPVTSDNLAILHTSWFSEKWTRELSASYVVGRYYRFDAIVVAPPDVLERVEKVTYYLSPGFPSDRAVRVVTDKHSRFRLRDAANGTFILRATLDIVGQQEALKLNRFIDLHEEGLRV